MPEGDEPADRPLTLPPEDLESDPDDLILEWAIGLDAVDYLTLLGLSRSAAGPTDADVRAAWRAFALEFHPDRHRDAEPHVRDAATRVFQRGAEAYRVLLDPLLRRRYLRLLERGVLRMSPEEIADAASGDAVRMQDIAKSAAASPFARRADELIAAGDLKQAKLQLQLAVLREPQNGRLQEAMQELDEAIATKKR